MKNSEELFEKLIVDESFISWIKNKQDPKWDKWLNDNPDRQEIVHLAEALFNPFRFKREEYDASKVEKIKNNIDENILIFENSNNVRARKIHPWVLRAAVVGFFLAVSSGLYFVLNNLKNPSKEIISKNLIEKSTHRGQKLTTNLPDGSVVVLNSSSSVKYEFPFSGNERIVYLEGEAFFDVVRDTLAPFKVVTEQITTTALGTSFNINSFTSDIEIALVTGKVQVSKGSSDSVILYPGEMAVVQESGRIDVELFDPGKKIAWKDGVLYFDHAPLYEIIEKLEEWYGVDISIQNSSDSDIVYSGYYDNEYLKEVLEGLAFVYHFNYHIDKKNVEIMFNK
ncbi:MAG: DUF4974 domain-containing protein [Cytophagales bacterium]|nr:DUF4974 domain-containing protein [Cytophagales bacterium]